MTVLFRRIAPTTLFALAAVFGCDSDGDEPASKPDEASVDEAKPDQAEADAKAEPEGPWSAWDMDARRDAWQGAHVSPTNGGLAIFVEGETAKVWDGKAEKSVAFELKTPCEAKFTETSDDGSRTGWTSHYTLEGGKVVTGLGDAGSRKGKEAVACVSNVVVTMDASGACTEWKASMFDDGEPKATPATCRWFEKDGKEIFGVTVRDTEYELIADGDTLWSQQLSVKHSEPAADFEAAKAARDAK